MKQKKAVYMPADSFGVVFSLVLSAFSQYRDCHVNRTYPRLVPALRDGEIKEAVIMDTGVERP